MKFTIYDLRFTICKDADSEHPHMFSWLLLVIPPALALFFWWGERARQKLLTQFIEARLLVVADGRHFAGAAENPVRAVDFGGRAFDHRHRAAAIRIMIWRRSSRAAWTSSWRWTRRNPCWRRTSRRTGWSARSSPRWN